jgi:hypothetical protein
MFKCPKCSYECDFYDEANKACMFNTEIIDKLESLQRLYESNPRKCFAELD